MHKQSPRDEKETRKETLIEEIMSKNAQID